MVSNGSGYFVAKKNIHSGEEVTADYREIVELAKILDEESLCLDG
jgi:hypothetical protein